jgi:ABC-type multidrug transport system ATPase subunit
MSVFIRSFQLLGSSRTERLVLQYPDETSTNGSVNVIAGPNNAGKSYTIERIAEVLRNRNPEARRERRPNRKQEVEVNPAGPRHFEVELELTDDGPPLFALLRQNTRHMVQCGRLNLHLAESRYELPDDLPDYRRRFRNFLLRQASRHLGSDLVAQFEKTKPNDVSRRQLFAGLEPVERLYLCDRSDALVRRLEEVLGATLYFRCSQSTPQQMLEWVLAYDDDTMVPFDEWSDGQKFNFYAGTLLELSRPDIVLIDEIENHLHPAYITRLLETLRSRRLQAIIVTHHPHVIFSELVDTVFYLERRATALIDPPNELKYLKHRDRRAPSRRAVSLADDFEKISYTYRLFDQHDNQLMRMAIQLEGEADLSFYRAVAEVCCYPPVAASVRGTPDTQTVQLAERITDLLEGVGGPVRILDLGAGIGRSAQELSKVPSHKTGHVQWFCWEPNKEYRIQLRTTLAATGLDHRVLDSLDEIDGQMHLCLLANVLHELVPEDAADVLHTAVRKLDPRLGSIVVLELYPLLAAEKYAAPYPESVLLDVFIKAGMSADVVRFSVRGGLASAYCILARPLDPNDLPSREMLETAFKQAWDQLEKQALAQYSNRRAVRTFNQYRQLLQQMTTIASIGAWRQRLWRATMPSGNC